MKALPPAEVASPEDLITMKLAVMVFTKSIRDGLQRRWDI